MQEDPHQLLRSQVGLVLRTRLSEEQPEEEGRDLLRRPAQFGLVGLQQLREGRADTGRRLVAARTAHRVNQ